MTGTGTPAPASTPSPAQAPPSTSGSPAQPTSPPPAAPATPAPGGPAPGGGAAPAPSRQEQMGVPNEVVAVLGYDPFGPEEPGGQPVAPAPPQPAAPATPPQAAPPAATPAQPAVSPEVAELRQQVQQLTTRLGQIGQPAPTAQPGAQPGGQPQDPVPPYTYEIPDQILNLMASENPADRKMALGSVMTAVSRSVHGLMQRELSQVIPALARHVMMEHLNQQEVGRDFYGTYKALDKPELRPLIHQMAMHWVSQNPGVQWNTQTRDTIARLAFQTFNMPMPAELGGTPAQPAAQPPAPAPVMMPTMARPAAEVQMSEQDELADMLR